MMNIQLFLSPLQFESRLFKEIHTLLSNNMTDQVYAVGLHREHLQEFESIEPGATIHRIKLKTEKLPRNILIHGLKYLEWMLKVGWLYRKKGVKTIHCHSLPALPAAFILKWLTKAPLIYDAHELETEQVYGFSVKKMLFKLCERALIPFCDHIYVVSDSIAAWYKRTYKLSNQQVYVIKNLPKLKKKLINQNIFRKKFSLREEDMIFLYQGLLGAGRGIERILEEFSRIKDKHKHLVIMGYGDLEKLVLSYSQKHSNIHFHEAVAPEEVLSHTICADVGICLLENHSLSYYYALPNKVAEFILAGLPILTSPFPEMKHYAENLKLGWTLDNNSSLSNFVEAITPDDLQEKKQAITKEQHRFDWSNEEKHLIHSYQTLNEATANQKVPLS